jgi:hypothetical protein
MKNVYKLVIALFFSAIISPINSQEVLKRAEKRSIKNDQKLAVIPEDQLAIEQCATEEIMFQEAALNSEMSIEERESSFDEYLKNSSYEKVDGEITVIPVVVHIVHLGEAEGVANNISDAQILSAIVQLNDRFRKTPGTQGGADGVDTEIEFCLASVDPEGNPSDGIVRVDGSSVVGYTNGGVCINSSCTNNQLAVKNLSRWPNTEYYNIWVVSEIMNNNGGFGIQGFAYYPGSSVAYDGMVIMNTCFGSMGTVNLWNNMGRTLTHEMGHGMGLYHSFEGDNSGSTCPSATAGDYVSDTDPHKRSSSNCPSGINPCTGFSSSNVVHNYMDYSSQSCADMFTQGQSDRMNSQISFFRSALATSTACSVSDVVDLVLTRVVNNQSYQCGASYTPIVNAYNLGSDPITSINFTYSYDGGAANTYSWTGTLSTGDSLEISLTEQVLSFTPHTLSVNGVPNQTDDFPSNNDINIAFETLNKDPYTLEIVLNNFGSENSWEVMDATSSVLAFGGPYANGQNGLSISEDVCFPSGCNQFVFYESYGDGMGSGSYILNDDGGNPVATGWNTPNATTFPTPMFESTSLDVTETSISASDNTICQGTSVDLTASGGDSYSWSTGQSGTSITVTPTVTTTYSVTATLNGCVGNEVMLTVVVLQDPTAIISPANPELCEGESITLTASGATSYSWSNGQTGSSISVSPNENTSYSVIPNNGCVGLSTDVTVTVNSVPVTSISGSSMNICEGSSVTLIASGGETYSWNTGATSAEMVVAPSITTLYNVTAYNGECAGNTESIQVNVNSAPYTGPSTSVELCSNEGTQELLDYLIGADANGQWYDPDGAPFSNLFDPELNDAGDYLYVVSGMGECEDASSVLSIDISQQPNAGVSTSISVNIDADEISLIDFLPNSDPGGSWSNPSGDPFDGLFDPSTDAEGLYVYAFNPDAPCSSSSAIVSVSISGTSNAGQNASVFFCTLDGATNLFPLLMGADVGGNWTGPNGTFNGIIDPLNDPSGDYVYSIGESSAMVTVVINESPEPIISIDDVYGMNEDIIFDNTGSTFGVSNWVFGDGSTSVESNPHHIYTAPGFYTVTLTLENEGCVGNDEHGVIINDYASGISEAFIEDKMLIYPNPGNGMFKLKFDLGEQHEVRYDVFNSTGKLIRTSGLETVSEATYTINLIAQSSGLYFIRIYVSDVIVRKKLMKSN